MYNDNPAEGAIHQLSEKERQQVLLVTGPPSETEVPPPDQSLVERVTLLRVAPEELPDIAPARLGPEEDVMDPILKREMELLQELAGTLLS